MGGDIKHLIFGVCVVFVLLSAFVGVASAATWYVEEGESIQAAIDNASTGDTIFVYNGTYYGAVNIAKSITLRGEDANTTTIHGEWLVNKVVYITAANATVCGFTVTGAVASGAYGIYVSSTNYCNISDNIVSGGDYGIYLTNSDYSVVSRNDASHRRYGIYLSSCDNCLLDKNIANANNEYGIRFSSSSNNVITNNTVNSNRYGIYLYSSSNYNTLTNNVVNSNSYYGICLYSSSNYNILTNNSANTNRDHGISLYSSSYNNIKNNIANSNYDHGIYLSSSSNNNITDSTVNLNSNDGIYLSSSCTNNITNNTASNNNYGIHLESSSTNNVIAANTISYNDKGIHLYYSGNNLLYHNNLITNTLQAYDYNGFNDWDNGATIGGNYWSDHKCIGNPSNGSQPYTKIDTNAGAIDHYPFEDYCGGNPFRTIYVPNDYGSIQDAVNATNPGDTIIVRDGVYTENVNINKGLIIRSENGSATTTIQASNPNDHVFEVTRDYVTISGFTVKGATGSDRAGIYLSNADHCNLSGNDVMDNYYGIRLYSSSNYNTLTNNTVNSNSNYGIYLAYSSSNNNLTYNTANANGYGIHLYSSSNYNTLTNNTVNSNSNYGIYLYSSSNNNLTYNTANANGYGIRLYSSSNYNTLTNNTVNANSNYGFYLSYSSNNNITNNNINSNNNYGIYLYSSSNNNLIYNNYFNNTHNAYDSCTNIWNITKTNGTNIIGGPYLGGNYWSDYTGIDNDGDGLGDTPYSIPGGSNTDYLPLTVYMLPTTPKTIYVDDDFTDDPQNHTWDTIQEGLSDANNSDTIIVYNGTYYGEVIIRKSVMLRGEDANNTIIHGEWTVEKVVYVVANNVTVSGFSVTGATCEGGYGIYAIGANCNISDNNITDGRYGIYLSDSENSTISRNNASGRCADGIHLEYSNGCVVSDNIANSNMERGIYLRYSSNSKIENNIANSNRYENVYLYSSSNCTLINNSANNSRYEEGIYVYSSSNCKLENNIANSNDDYGIYLSSSSNCTLINNIANSNDVYGIYLSSSSNCDITNNIANSNYYANIYLPSSNYCNITNNIANSSHNDGIYFSTSCNCNITDNTVDSNNYGIRLLAGSMYNKITNNNVSHNKEYGTYLHCSGNNEIYHNNIIENNKQAYDHKGFNEWDKGPIIGGNYWSDHVCHGNPSDGTEPYTGIDTDADAVDNYPFEGPNGWVIPPPLLPDLTISPSDILFEPKSPIEGKSVIISATVHNIGTKNASNVTVRFFDEGDQIESDQIIDFIDIEEEETVSIAWNTAGEAGVHIITVKVDPDNEIEERSETNNNASKDITIAEAKPRVSISTDKQEYHPGDIMDITIRLQNPTESTQQAFFAWYLILPDDDYWQEIMSTEITLPPGFDESFSIPLPIKYWAPVEFNATWDIVLLDKTTSEIISEDTADWRYVPSAEAQGETIPEAIGKEIMEKVEGVGLQLPS